MVCVRVLEVARHGLREEASCEWPRRPRLGADVTVPVVPACKEVREVGAEDGGCGNPTAMSSAAENRVVRVVTSAAVAACACGTPASTGTTTFTSRASST